MVSIFTGHMPVNICAVAYPTECSVVLWEKSSVTKVYGRMDST